MHCEKKSFVLLNIKEDNYVNTKEMKAKKSDFSFQGFLPQQFHELSQNLYGKIHV